MADINQSISVVNIGLEGFFNDLSDQGAPVIQVDWRPPAGGDTALIDKLARLERPEVEAANAATIARMMDSRPLWVDVQPAIKAIPGMEPNDLLHSGPPIDFRDMCDPQQRAVEAAAILEGWISGREDLEAKLKNGSIKLRHNYDLGSVGAMCGIISPSMQVVVTENVTYGNRSWSTFNEGKGIAEGTSMGDEVHARSAACTLLLLRQLTPMLLATSIPRATVAQIIDFLAQNNHSFLSLTLTACKAAADAAHGVKNSTVVTAMSRNGVNFALRVGGMDQWFITPTAPMDEAIYYSGYGPEDAAGDIGDSAIVETAGLGGMIIGAAPSISSFVGGSMQHSRRSMAAMRSICAGANPKFAPGSVDFTPAPLGVDIRKVVRLGLTPIIDTGVLHKASGVGQIGTGIARAPLAAFRMALEAMPLPG